MEKDNSIKKLITILEPLIQDLEEQGRVLADRKDKLEKVSRLIAYTKDNIEMVGIYADQNLIIDNLEKLKINKEEYKAGCYLLKSDNEVIKKLPQYERAYSLISDIIEYFKLYKSELIVEIKELTLSFQKKEREKKYYDILSYPNPLIEDNDEFIEFINEHELNSEEVIEILYSTIHNNVVNYELKNK